MSNPNPPNKFRKGVPRPQGAGRQPNAVNHLSTDVRRLIREAAHERTTAALNALRYQRSASFLDGLVA